MAYFDIDDQQLTPEAEAENRRRMLGMLASAAKTSVLGAQPAANQPTPPPPRLTPRIPEPDLGVPTLPGRPVLGGNLPSPERPPQPTPPPSRLTPTQPPDVGGPTFSGTAPLGQPAVRPARPDVMPTREDFPVKPLPTWEKVLGIAAAPFLPNLTQNLLGRPQREAGQQYNQAVQDYERGQLGRVREANLAKTGAETTEALARAEDLRTKTVAPPDENKQPLGADGAAQHAQQLETLTGSMAPQQKQQFLAAYSASATDTHAVATKRLEDAKGAASLSAGEQDRALQRDIAKKNHEDAQANIAENRAQRQQQQDEKQVIAYDPKTKERSLMTAGEARQRGLTVKSEAKAGDEEKAGEFNAQANDVQMNTSRYRTAMNQVRTPFSKTDTLNATQILASPPAQSYLLGQIGFGTLTDQLTQGDRAKAWNALPPDKQAAIVGYLRMRGSAIAYQKMLTNQGRTSKEGLDIELANIPSPILGATVANKQLDAFQENIDVAAQRAVRLPWMETPKDVRTRIEGQAPEGGAGKKQNDPLGIRP